VVLRRFLLSGFAITDKVWGSPQREENGDRPRFVRFIENSGLSRFSVFQSIKSRSQ
jgi:hypothetical protein